MKQRSHQPRSHHLACSGPRLCEANQRPQRTSIQKLISRIAPSCSASSDGSGQTLLKGSRKAGFTRPHSPLKFGIRISFLNFVLLALALAAQGAAPVVSLSKSGSLTATNTFTNGVCIVEHSSALEGQWTPLKNTFTTATVAQVGLVLNGSNDFFRAQTLDLSGGRAGFTNLTRAYGLLSTIAGSGAPQEQINWRPEHEGALATTVPLSGPHMTAADKAGNYYIADKDAHGIRKIRLDGTIVTVAGTSALGNGPDGLTPATQVALNAPNGLWVKSDGTVYILDQLNAKVRRLDTNGMLQTLFTSPSGISIGRGLWVNDDETLAYFSSGTIVKRWTPSQGVTDFSTGYLQLGNLGVNGAGRVIVTDRSAHRVYLLDQNGVRTPIAGTGGTLGGGDGLPALNTALQEVRAVWLVPNGGMFVATHRGSQVWYIDPSGLIHLFLHGTSNDVHAGDGTWFYNPLQPRVSEIRSVTMDYDGNVIITENDFGYVRKVRFLPMTP